MVILCENTLQFKSYAEGCLHLWMVIFSEFVVGRMVIMDDKEALQR